ncbi:hypothetical protein MCOR14_003800 [Pyricularia oryzae]|nr:hypothetical protein MCOR34_001395 [Pyricularia oryzae]KAI6495382.1 hypothetical protein MCOR11_005408 [Pyricularia oryzae]KAI6639639.1 hypothetical protein MCOR14_003800 [Pyricularia oryzae]
MQTAAANLPTFCLRHDHDGNPDDDVLSEIATKMPLAIEASNPLDIDSTLFDPENTCFNVGNFTHKRLSPTLLAICRRVFIEAHLLIFKNERGHQVEEQRFWKSWIPKSRPDSPEGKPGVDKSCIACAYWSRERTEWERRFTMLNFSGGLDYYQSFLSNQSLYSS